MSTHSPLPWRIAPDEPLIVETMDGSEIADCSMLNASMPKADDAAFIVRAVNNHQQMLDTLKELLSKMDEDHWFHDQTAEAIARAEGGK